MHDCARHRNSLFFLSIFFIIIFAVLHGCGSSPGGKKNKKNPPDPPENLNAVSGDGSVTLTWDTKADATSYNLYMASQSGITKENYTGLSDGMKHAGVTSPYTHPNLANGKTYYFVVTAVNSNGESKESNEVSAIPQQQEADKIPPAAIANLTTGTVTTSSITLSWTAPGDDDNTGTVASYDIRYSTVAIGNTNWVDMVTISGEPLPKTAGTTEDFTVTGLDCGTIYYFAVMTSDEVPNSSPISNIATGATSACPDSDAPTNTTGDDFINNGAVYTNSATVNLTISAEDPDGVTGYYVSEDPTTPLASTAGWIAISNTTSYAGTVSFTLSSENDVKNIYVWFMDSVGNVSTSRSDSIILDNTPPEVSLFPFSGPLSKTVTLIASASDDMSGIKRVEFFAGDVKLGEVAAFPYSLTWETTGISDGLHTLKATAYDGAGNSETSENITASVDNTPPPAPSGLTAQVINIIRIDLSWTAPADNSGISYYNIYRDGVLIGTSNTTSFSDTSISFGTTYMYTVSAVDMVGNESERTSPINGMTNLAIAITSPKNLITVATSPISVSGIVNDNEAAVTVNGVPAAVANGQFEVNGIVITEGMNTIVARANDKDDNVATSSINISLDSTPPQIAITSPTDGYRTASSSITVTGTINDIVRGTVNDNQGSVIVNGIDASISNRNFMVETVPLNPGLNTITASGSDNWGNTASTSITVEYDNTPRKVINIISGNNQSGTISSTLPDPLVISVTDKNNSPVSGATVVYSIIENNGILSIGDSSGRTVSAVTDSNGTAQAVFTLGTWAGSGNNKIEVSAAGVEDKVIFTESGEPKPPAAIYVAQGGQQRGAVNQFLPEPLVAFVTDKGHNPLDNVPVIFKAVEGGGFFTNGLDTISVNTDSDGRATVAFALGSTAGNDSNVMDATFEGNSGPPASFTATGLVPGDPGNTRISGVVLDNSNNPIQNVTMRVEETTREAKTDANGQFVIENVPVGPVHLIADGTTAGIRGVIEYPRLMYELTTIAGANNTVGMPIYLLPLDLTNAKWVGGSDDVTYIIPDIPGFELTIKANSVTFPNGSKEGYISVTKVHADKVPMVPQIGQQPRFIITIQPPGAVFDPPAPITLPNVDGLAPGEKTNMYSFDHDLGIFVSIGTGTVSEDGMVIQSDPGVGVVKAGWHCGGNPSPTGCACNCSQCQECVNNKCENVQVTITTPPDNPNPSDATFAMNFSFLSNDTINAQGSLNPPSDTSKIEWEVTATIGGIQNEDPPNKKGPTFKFEPNPPAHPPYGTAGSYSRSNPLSYNIKANFCSNNDTNTIAQDQLDIIRQEYLNHGITIPTRNEFNTPVATTNFTVAEINKTAYSVNLGQPGQLAQSIYDAYNHLINDDVQEQPVGTSGLLPTDIVVSPGGNIQTIGPILDTKPCNGAPNPSTCDDQAGGNAIVAGPNGIAETQALNQVTNFGLIITSAWRNPERNEKVGGVKNSRHQFGNAVDLVIQTAGTGKTSAQLFCILQTAADSIPGTNGFAEHYASQRPCTAADVTHVHSQQPP